MPASPRSSSEPGSAGGLRITLVKSPIGYSERHKATVRGLGLRRLHQTVIQPDNGPIRGMIAKVQHLVRVETAEATGDGGAPTAAPRRRSARAGAAPSTEDTDETA